MVASQLFSADDRKAISAAVAEAEKKTAAEIVPVVATMSDRYERAEDVVGLGVAATAVAAVWTMFQGVKDGADWDAAPDLTIHVVSLLALFAAGWVVGILLAKMIPPLKRLVVSRRTSIARVLVAAHHAFDSLHVKHTKAATGVVIYVSLFERRVCVWADRSISEKVPESEWKDACATLTHALKEGKPREGFVAAIQKLGDVLAKPFPIQPKDVDELSNELRVLD